MKTIKEQLLEIIYKAMVSCFEMGLKQSPTDAENSEFYLPLIGNNLAPKVFSDIEFLIKERFVEREFIDWYDFVITSQFFPQEADGGQTEYFDYYGKIGKPNELVTFDALYQYWLIEVKSKQQTK